MASVGGGVIIKDRLWCRRCLTNLRGKPDKAEALPIFASQRTPV
jgi:hypothetical protein